MTTAIIVSLGRPPTVGRVRVVSSGSVVFVKSRKGWHKTTWRYSYVLCSPRHCYVWRFPGFPACPSDINTIKMNMGMEHWRNGTDSGKQMYWKKPLSLFHSVHHESHTDWPGTEAKPQQWLNYIQKSSSYLTENRLQLLYKHRSFKTVLVNNRCYCENHTEHITQSSLIFGQVVHIVTTRL
jgi:hypothetical protein